MSAKQIYRERSEEEERIRNIACPSIVLVSGDQNDKTNEEVFQKADVRLTMRWQLSGYTGFLSRSLHHSRFGPQPNANFFEPKLVIFNDDEAQSGIVRSRLGYDDLVAHVDIERHH